MFAPPSRTPCVRPVASVAACGAFLLAAACGRVDGPPPGAASSSVADPSGVSLRAPPPIETSVRFGAVTCSGRPDSPAIHLADGTPGSAPGLDASGVGVTGLAVVEQNGVRHLVCASIDAEQRLILERFHDTDGDGRPDAATRTRLLTSGTDVMFVVSIAARSASRMYFADARCGDIVVAVDSDRDGWVDRVVPKRFARREDRPDLALADLRFWHDPTSGEAFLLATPEFGKATADLKLPVRRFRLAADGLTPDADEMGALPDRRPVIARGFLVAGQDRIEVMRAGTGKPSDAPTYEAWRLDKNDADVEKLGEVTLAAGMGVGLIRTHAPLLAGWRVAVRARGDRSAEVRFDVRGVRPAFESVTPETVPPGKSVVVTIHGTGFTADMSVRLLRGGTTEPVPFTFGDATTLTVTLPPLAEGVPVGLAGVGVGQAVEDPTDPLRAVEVRVRAP